MKETYTIHLQEGLVDFASKSGLFDEFKNKKKLGRKGLGLSSYFEKKIIEDLKNWATKKY